ncbi:MAG: 3'-5' exonuclease [Campylobacteraceae bacterium]|nr:3'-5' exonuclease [Campylobacteraceae bacterium]
MRRFDGIAQQLAKNTMSKDELAFKIATIDSLAMYEFDNCEFLRLMGLPLLDTSESLVTLSTRLTSVQKQRYCIVDIETSASDVKKGQIIEIGAMMLEGGHEIDRFESLVHATYIPDPIQHLTGITPEILVNAPSLGSVLEKFRLFLGDAVFVAHNVGFDYSFISQSMQLQGFGPMLNRKLCTICLAQKTIEAERYGLGYLRNMLGIDIGEHHRALSDAYSAAYVFKKALENLPKEICTAEDLIYFSNQNHKKSKKRDTL